MSDYKYESMYSEDESLSSYSIHLEHGGRRNWRQKGSNVVTIMIWSLLSSVISLSIGVSLPRRNEDTGLTCWRTDSFWSPALDFIDLSYHQRKFKGSLDAPSEYRGEPSESVDQAWEELEEVGTMWITPEEFEQFGGDPETSVRLSDEEGGLYAGELEVFHQLHCVNYMRKASYWYHDHYVDTSLEFTDSEATQKMHFDHCIEMLRHQLTCKADVGFINLQWVNRTALGYYPNFNTVHQCRNYNSIRNFVLSRRWPDPVVHSLKMQPGQQALAHLP